MCVQGLSLSTNVILRWQVKHIPPARGGDPGRKPGGLLGTRGRHSDRTPGLGGLTQRAGLDWALVNSACGTSHSMPSPTENFREGRRANWNSLFALFQEKFAAGPDRRSGVHKKTYQGADDRGTSLVPDRYS